MFARPKRSTYSNFRNSELVMADSFFHDWRRFLLICRTVGSGPWMRTCLLKID
jgi:hypothetical protein